MSIDVSLVTTVRDEAEQLPELLRSISDQSVQPSEVIVVDGGSTDETLDVLRSWQSSLPLTIIEAPGANISCGRNIAIAQARCEIVAVTDAGVRLERDWLEHLIAPFQNGCDSIDVVGGFFVPDTRTLFESALAATTLPDVDEIEPGSFLPSSRSLAFRRSWFTAGIRYPEWLDYCEDLIFDLRLKRAGARFAFQPRAVVRFRPRTSAIAFWRQYYLYARGDGKSGLFFKRHMIRYATYLVVLPSLIFTRSWLWRGLVGIGALAYMRKPVLRLVRRTDVSPRSLAPMVVRSASLRALGDLAKMAGYPVGLLWRARKYGLKRNWQSIPEKMPDPRTH